MQLHLTIDVRAVFLAFALLVIAAALATPIAISFAETDTTSAPTAELGTAFTYQGRLDADGVPASGAYDFQFTLFDAENLGTAISGPVAATNVAVKNGLFSVPLSFGMVVFDGSNRWLSIEVSNSGANNFELLSPRTQLTPTPYALFAGNGPFWKLGGNSGTTANDFLGTTDGQPLELRVNGLRVLRLEPGVSPNVIEGIAGNSVTTGAIGATIGGGGGPDVDFNRISDDFGTVGGGYDNRTGDGEGTTSDRPYATVGGGNLNIASGKGAVVAGGESNRSSAEGATVGGGFGNSASGFVATVPGGLLNSAAGDYSFAAGLRAKVPASADGSFVWADNHNVDFAPATANAFSVRATGGIFLTVKIDANGNGLQACSLTQPTPAWACFSDRNLKTNFADVDGQEILSKLDEVPIQYWTVKDIEGAPPHMGPMAQDFFAAFGLGDSDRTISTIDLDGVSLAAIKGLHGLSKEQDARIAALEAKAEVGLASGAGDAPVGASMQKSGGDSWTGTWALPGAILVFALAVAGHAAVSLRRRAA